MNAKEELLSNSEGFTIKCAYIHGDNCWRDEDDPPAPTYLLKVNHSEEDLQNFLNSLDFNYNAGFGGQELFGEVWFTDGTWMDRGEYDGSEWWNHQIMPEIPESLL
jgi:hypothetical protein